MPTPVWTAISDAYIATDGFGTAFLARLLRDNGAHLKAVIEGAADAPKVPAQVFAQQAAGSGLGLVAKSWNHQLYTIPSTAVTNGTTVELDTGIFSDGLRAWAIAMKVTAGATPAIEPRIVEKPGGASGKYFLALTNSGTSSGTVEGTVLFLSL